MSGVYEGLARTLDREMAERVKGATMSKTSKKKARMVKVYAPFSGYNRAARRKLLRGESLSTLRVPTVAPAPSKMGQWLGPASGESLESSEPEGEGG